jgi:hypothetical protein
MAGTAVESTPGAAAAKEGDPGPLVALAQRAQPGARAGLAVMEAMAARVASIPTGRLALPLAGVVVLAEPLRQPTGMAGMALSVP